jgi:hypothetical protein
LTFPSYRRRLAGAFDFSLVPRLALRRERNPCRLFEWRRSAGRR